MPGYRRKKNIVSMYTYAILLKKKKQYLCVVMVIGFSFSITQTFNILSNFILTITSFLIA